MNSVEPITSRQSGELARLLEERGIGKQGFQKLIEHPEQVVSLLNHDFHVEREPSIDMTTSLYDIEDDPDSWWYGDTGRLYRVGVLFSAVRNALDQEGKLSFSRDPNIADLLSLSEAKIKKQPGVGSTMIRRLQSWLDSKNLPRLQRF
jgi:hypothetical protein